MQVEGAAAAPRVAIYNRPKIRAVFYQLVVLAALLWLGFEIALNAKANLDARKITTGFGFLDKTRGVGHTTSAVSVQQTGTPSPLCLCAAFTNLLAPPSAYW